ncbi:hypothetical protein ACFIN9_00060 [Streptomyces noursei]
MRQPRPPPAEDFGLTVTASSEYVWLHTPTHPLRPASAALFWSVNQENR